MYRLCVFYYLTKSDFECTACTLVYAVEFACLSNYKDRLHAFRSMSVFGWLCRNSALVACLLDVIFLGLEVFVQVQGAQIVTDTAEKCV